MKSLFKRDAGVLRMKEVGWTMLILMLLLSPGCVTREMAARKIMTAPNKQYSLMPIGQLTALWRHYNPGHTNSPFIYMKVQTGAPEAKLSLVEFPPGDYHLKFNSKSGTGRNGKFWMTVECKRETNATFTPLKQPATIVILHGYMLSKETMAPWAFLLAQAGYRVVLVDLRGHGESTGDTATYGKYETGDLMRVLDYLKAQQLCDEKIGVLGLSYGATLALHWAAHDPRVKTVVAIAPYDHPEEAAERLAKEFKIPVSHKTLAAALAEVSQRLKLNWADWSGEAAMRESKEPVLLIGGGRDRICPPLDMEKLKEAAPPGSKLISIAEANHFAVGFWLQELKEPVEMWLREHLAPAGDVRMKVAKVP